MKKALLGLVALLLVGFAIKAIVKTSGGDVQGKNTRILKDMETGELFEITLTPDLPPYPHKNPKTGTMTLYPTELCYSSECAKKGGTRVILNVWRGKDEPTYCPECGTLVRFHNPKPRSGDE